LDSIQDAIRTQEKIIEKTKELNKSMMADLFKYGGPSFRKGRKLKKTEIGEIPENWEVVTIKNIGEVVTGTTPSTLVKDYWNGDIPFVTPTDITKKYVENTERYISQKGLQKARLLPKDSILVTCIASIGKISITPKPCISNQQINAIICKENIDNEYIYYVMNHMSDRLKMWAGQTTSPIVKKSLFEKFILPLPKDKNEQREIAEILQTIDQKIEIEQKKKALYEELFRTMLNKLMTGEIRVDNLKL
jgi:type I restriction enzyme S subunit